MTVDREEASALLKDVEGMESRVRQILIYAHISDFFFLWAVIFAGGFTANYFLREKAGAMVGAGRARPDRDRDHRVLSSPQRRRTASQHSLAGGEQHGGDFVAFGTLWTSLLHMGWREEVTFWPTFLSFLVFLVGLWLGRTLVLAAAAIFAISLAGYFFAGPYLLLWMAAAMGGSLFAAGLWLRR